ncbi:hypothetical protein ACFPIJ_50965 [Dactylosporangium cerinum]|uniref:Vegetative cell wall protein gp1 n=1 Tax=Dactylosporangium cerinum TaxID=1434730 RepID=A0ABV9WF30_9ACTN
MTALLATLGGKLADRWAAAILGPGLLFVGAVVCAGQLGQRHATDFGRLGVWISAVAADSASHSPGAVLLFGVGVLLASIAAGLGASAAGRVVERVWLVTGERPPASALRIWRRRRWSRADERVELARDRAVRAVVLGPAEAADAAAVYAAALARRNAICLVEPDRPGWMADRLLAADARVHRAYAIDLGAVWPRLWSVSSAELRADLGAVQDAYAGAARLQGWGLLYVTLGLWWWPALLVGAGTLVAGHARGRAAAGVLAELVETAVDLHGRDLANRLGIVADGPLHRGIGLSITEIARKDGPPRPPVADGGGHG